MLKQTLILGAFGAALLCGTGAMAQGFEPEEVIVRPETFVQKHQLPGINGATQISVSRRVGYSDLDLSLASDRDELAYRIRDTARAVCREVDRQAPPFSRDLDNRNCVSAAIVQAMNDVEDIIANRAG